MYLLLWNHPAKPLCSPVAWVSVKLIQSELVSSWPWRAWFDVFRRFGKTPLSHKSTESGGIHSQQIWSITCTVYHMRGNGKRRLEVDKTIMPWESVDVLFSESANQFASCLVTKCFNWLSQETKPADNKLLCQLTAKAPQTQQRFESARRSISGRVRARLTAVGSAAMSEPQRVYGASVLITAAHNLSPALKLPFNRTVLPDLGLCTLCQTGHLSVKMSKVLVWPHPCDCLSDFWKKNSCFVLYHFW